MREKKNIFISVYEVGSAFLFTLHLISVVLVQQLQNILNTNKGRWGIFPLTIGSIQLNRVEKNHKLVYDLRIWLLWIAELNSWEKYLDLLFIIIILFCL